MITIYNNTIIYSYYSENAKADLQKEIQPFDIIGLMWEPVQIDTNVTLRRIFDIVKACVPLWTIIANEKIQPVIDEMNLNKDFDRPLVSDFIDHLEIFWETEQSNGRIYASASIQGYGNGEYYGIGYTPSYNVVDIKIQLNEDFILYDYDFDIHHGCAPVQNRDYLGKKYFTFIEIVKGIFGELTILGPPKEREKRIGEMSENFPEFFKSKDRTS